MALTIIKTRRKVRDFLTYDLEWIPGRLEVRLVGVYDGERYRCYDSVDVFLDSELTSRNRGKWFYAHAGGLADFQFVLERLVERSDFQVKCAFSGSSAIISTVRRGKNAWNFVDSYWLLRDKLDNIAKWIGLEKGESERRQTEEEAREFYAKAPIYELITYNEQDCVILWQAIQEMQLTLLELGGQLQKTLASSAMNLFRRQFLSKDIPTNWGVNAKAQDAYFASRVEVLNSECWNAEYYDINSSFPYAMTKSCPGEYIGSSKYLPDYGLYMGDVVIEVPECYLPPIPMRLKGRLFFPCGVWRTWLTSVDIELLQKMGCKILKVYEVLMFEPFHDLRDYAQTLYELRKKAATPFERTAYKLLLNSLYGKFAEGEQKSSLVIDPDRHPLLESGEDNGTWTELFPGAWTRKVSVPIPHRHVPVSGHITARARQTLYEFMLKSVEKGEEVHYCDTDGFSTTNRYKTSNELGGLKLEKRIRHGRFVAPKVYHMDGDELQKDGSWAKLGDKGVKAKGFSRMSISKFEKLLEGESIEYERMRRIKEIGKYGSFHPVEDTIVKRLQRITIPKRFHYPDGHTRPWLVKELMDHFRGVG
jgi:hypothetical protein